MGKLWTTRRLLHAGLIIGVGAVVCAVMVVAPQAPPATAAPTHGGAAKPSTAAADSRAHQVVVPMAVEKPGPIDFDAAGNLYVADYDNARVVEVRADGSQNDFGPDSAYFEGTVAPFDMAVDPAGDVVTAGEDGFFSESQTHVRTNLPATAQAPGRMTIDSAGNLYTANSQQNLVTELAPGASTVTTLAFTGLDQPYVPAVDGAGDVFVADVTGTDIEKLTPAGVQTKVTVTGLTSVSDIVADAAGDLFVSDSQSKKVVEVAANGTQTTMGFTGLTSPSWLAVDTTGDLYVVDGVGDSGEEDGTRILELPAGGAQQTVTIGGVDSAAGDALDAAGDLFVLDGGNDDILERTPGGSTHTIAVSGVSTPNGLAADAAGDLFVSDVSSNQVVELPASGSGQRDLAFSGLKDPADVAVDQHGDVFVVDNGNDRVLELDPQGDQTVLPFGDITDPSTLAVDPAGDVYVGWSAPPDESAAIDKLAAGASQPTLVWQDPGGLSYISALATDQAGDLYAGEVLELVFNDQHGAIVAYSPSGTATTISDVHDTGASGLALDAAGDLFESDGSVLGAVSEFPPVAPTVPTTPTAAPGNGSATISWTAPGYNGDAPITGYLVTPYVNGSALAPVSEPASLSATIGGLANGASFSFTVAAANDVGTGPTSPLAAPIEVGTPTAPTAVSATAGDGTTTVGWTASAANGAPISGYTVAWYQGDTKVGSFTFTGTATSHVVDGLPYSSSVSFTVAAVNSVGYRAPIGTLEAAVTEGPPPAPQDVVAVTGDGLATLNWQAPTAGNGEPLTGYQVAVVGDGKTMFEKFGPSPTSQSIEGLANGQSYVFRVAGLYGTTVGPYTPSSQITIGVPAAPGAVTATGGVNRVQLQWTAPTTANGAPVTSYLIIVVKNGVPATPFATNSTATTYNLNGATDGAAYRFVVRATNSRGTGDNAGSASPVVPPFATVGDFVTRQYLDFAGRAPTATELASGVGDIQTGTLPGVLVSRLRASTDATTNVDPVARLYFAYFLRVPDAGGLTYWVSRKRAGESLYAISDTFAASSEFKARYGSLDNGQFVTLVYKSVLGRTPDPSGYAYWLGQLNSGSKTRGQVMVGFSESSEYRTLEQPDVDVAVTWIDMLGVAPTQAQFLNWVNALKAGHAFDDTLAQALLSLPSYSKRVG